MAQTPEQRRRNAKFARDQEAKMGKPDGFVKKREKATPKASISPFWFIILAFVVFGGLLFELLAQWWGK